MLRFLILVSQVYTPPNSLPQATASQSFLANILHIAFALAGAIALLIITLAGLQYITSQGDPQKTAKAKDTILYAIIGLIVCIMAYNIVSYVVKAVQ